MLQYFTSLFSRSNDSVVDNAAVVFEGPDFKKWEEESKILAVLKEKNPNYDYLAIICNQLTSDIIHRVSSFFQDLPESESTHVYIILHVYCGGDSSDCAILTKIFNRFISAGNGNQITMCVPEIAMSSGAQIALSGTDLVMGKYAHLSPFDDQIGKFGVKNVKRIMKHLETQKTHKFTFKEYDTILRAQYLRKITKAELRNSLRLQHYGNKTTKNVEQLFLNHTLYHSYPIDIDMIKDTGLRVTELIDNDIWSAYRILYNIWFGGSEDKDEEE